MSNSIQNINDLPSIDEVKEISQGLALIDAIIMPDWEYRYFSFNSNWDGNRGEMMASMRDGSGREYFINFADAGVAGKVFFEESLADVSSSLGLVPDCFSGFKNEAAFSLANATFFFWRECSRAVWVASPENLKAYPLLGFLVNGVAGYHRWAEDYYERSIDSDVLKDVFTSLAVTADQLAVLNPDVTLEDLEEDLQEIL
jgi:hypothetical protein